MRSPKWYHETWAIVVIGLVCPPLAVWLIVRKPGLSHGARALVLGAIGAIALSLALMELFGGLLGLGIARYRAFALRQRALFLESTNRTAEALEHVLEAWRLAPTDARAALDAATLAERLGRRAQAASLLTSVAKNSSVEAEATAQLGALWLKEADTFERGRQFVLDALDTGRLQKDEPHSLELQAQIEIARGDLRSAEYHLRRVVDQFRRDVFDRVYYQLARIAAKRQEPERELVFLCESLRSDVEHPQIVQRLYAAAAAARRALPPFRAFVRALELAHVMRAREQSARLLERLLATHKDFPYRDGCHYQLATYLFYDKRDYRAALAHYQAVTGDHPGSESYARALYQTGQCNEKLGLDADAARAYRKLVDVAPPGTTLHRMAALQLARMRRIGRIGAVATEDA